MRRFFGPAVGIPFVPADVVRYVPVRLFILESEVDTLPDKKPSLEPEEPEPPSTLLDASNKDVSRTKNKAWKRHQIFRHRELLCDLTMLYRFGNAIREKECFFRISFWKNRVAFLKQMFLTLLCFVLKTTEQECSTT
jgi:hypothetical protein